MHLQGSFIRVDSIIQCVFHTCVHFADDILFIRKNLLLCFFIRNIYMYMQMLAHQTIILNHDYFLKLIISLQV